MKRSELAQELTRMFESWNRTAVGPGVFAAYAEIVGHLSREQLAAGINAAIAKGGEHPPGAGALLKFCTRSDDSALAINAHNAYRKLESLARRHGIAWSESQIANEIDDAAAMHALAAIGGWRHFCCGKIDPDWQPRTFAAHYIEATQSPAMLESLRVHFGMKPSGYLAGEQLRIESNGDAQ